MLSFYKMNGIELVDADFYLQLDYDTITQLENISTQDKIVVDPNENKRFENVKPLSETQLQALKRDRLPKNTRRRNVWAIGAYEEWARWRNSQLVVGIQWMLREKKGRNDIHFFDTMDSSFAELRKQVDARMKELTNQAGIDTSRYTLKNLLLHMVAFPDIQEKVQEEIDRVVGRDRLPGLSDRPDLGYTEAVLHESMRLVTVVALGVQHMTICDTDVCGYRIPKDTIVTINHWALHNDPDAWEEVDRFIPERFLDENGKLGPTPKSWLPFSAGTRVCLGEFVAKPELHLIFACLMQRYKWKMVSGECPDITPTGGMNWLYCKPYKVIVERRF